MTEFNLSEHRDSEICSKDYWYPEEDVKKFIRLLKEEDNDLYLDLYDLLELNKVDIDLILKVRRLCKAHFEEKDKLAGDKLNTHSLRLL